MEWQLTPQFSFMARFAHDQYNEMRETKIPRSYVRDPNGVYGITDLYRRESNTDFLFSYTTEIGALSITLPVVVTTCINILRTVMTRQ
jgi:hypothetical protein